VAEPVTSEKPPEFVALEPILREHGFIKNEDIRRVLNISTWQANWIARKLVSLGWLEPEGKKKGRRYRQAGVLLRVLKELLRGLVKFG
jgi:Mn-dependent DtxR family transcriptional regulator